MTLAEIEVRTGDNLEATYLAIGGATPDARIDRREGYSLCLGRMDHPIGSFAVVRRMAPALPHDLALVGRNRASFNVYIPSDEPRAQTARLMHAAGFRRSYRLIQMTAAPRFSPSECVLVELKSEADRVRAAAFMTHQFFTRQRGSIREQIARATAFSGLDLYEICRSGQAIGAVMLSRAGDLFGIYNLCVDATKRRRGFGSESVHRLLSLAHEEGRTAVLQADPSLAPWYEGLGFKPVGVVEVYVPGR